MPDRAIRCARLTRRFAAADLARPVVLAEISPGNYNLIDGHHRMEQARLRGVETLQAFKLTAAQHVRFLTSTRAYRTYVTYWNGEVEEARTPGHVTGAISASGDRVLPPCE